MRNAQAKVSTSDAFYHATSRGNDQKEIFKSQQDREKFRQKDREKFLVYPESESIQQEIAELQADMVGCEAVEKG